MIDTTWLVDDILRVEGLLIEAAGSSSHALVSEPSLHLIKAGGKRLRPALTLACSRAGTPGQPATDLAAAGIELIHLATLYHDDVIDQTHIRRGVDTVSRLWGSEVAILVGDYLFARSCALGVEAGGEVPRILARALGEVCEGQVAETAHLGDPTRPIDDYIATIELKTAALFRAACECGASTAGAEPADVAALAEYGRHLGTTFQIVDDILDLVGSAEVLGKEPGTDIREGVYTLPVLLAARSDAAVVTLLTETRELEALLPSLRSTGALSEAADIAAQRAEAARRELDRFPESAWCAVLDALIDRVLDQVPAPADI